MTRDPLLFTPGPLTTRTETRQAMMRDWGSRDAAFKALTAELRNGLLRIANGGTSHASVLLQGSGTFIVEAAIATLVGPRDKLLVLVNGAYGERMVAITKRLGRAVEVLTWPEDEVVEAEKVAAFLEADKAITHVALVHCETTTGILNPLAEIAAVVAAAGRVFLLDAMSSFGALPLDLATKPIGAVLASSNKCLEGVPGIGFALIKKSLLEKAKGNSPSLSLDLHDQWQRFEQDGEWRFTPPVQIVAALGEALRLLEAEGGPPARLARYTENFERVVGTLEQLGFPLYLKRSIQAPIIATFLTPADFNFSKFYDALAAKGYLIYPGKLTKRDSFRIGCIGALKPEDFSGLLKTIGEIVS